MEYIVGFALGVLVSMLAASVGMKWLYKYVKTKLEQNFIHK